MSVTKAAGRSQTGVEYRSDYEVTQTFSVPGAKWPSTYEIIGHDFGFNWDCVNLLTWLFRSARVWLQMVAQRVLTTIWRSAHESSTLTRGPSCKLHFTV